MSRYSKKKLADGTKIANHLALKFKDGMDGLGLIVCWLWFSVLSGCHSRKYPEANCGSLLTCHTFQQCSRNHKVLGIETGSSLYKSYALSHLIDPACTITLKAEFSLAGDEKVVNKITSPRTMR